MTKKQKARQKVDVLPLSPVHVTSHLFSLRDSCLNQRALLNFSTETTEKEKAHAVLGTCEPPAAAQHHEHSLRI